jgi:hypothetical protein
MRRATHQKARAVLSRPTSAAGQGEAMNDSRHYAPIIIRSSVPTPWERKFLASLIAAERKGRALTPKQAQTLHRIVARFQDATMREDVIE